VIGGSNRLNGCCNSGRRSLLCRLPWPLCSGLGGKGDPRSAPSKGIHMLAHHCWVYPLDPCFDPISRDHAPPHIKLCFSFDVARNLAQLRIGSTHLEVEQGRKRRVSVPRADRLCRLCFGEDATLSHRRPVLARTGTSSNVEDLKHFMLDSGVLCMM
jgi:hypothetical protein